jgi:hypothetical protein
VSPFDDHLAFLLERSPFSEEFRISWEAGSGQVCLTALNGEKQDVPEGALLVRGIFDESVEREPGNKAIRKKPRICVYRWINPMPQETKVVVRGKEYTAVSYDKDMNMGIVVWSR